MTDAKKLDKQTGKPERTGLTGFQKLALWGTSVLLIASVITRVVLSSSGNGEVASSVRTAAQSGDQALAQTQGTFESILPYVTEGSLFGLIGFALGYTTRKILKVGLIVLAAAFIGVQVAVYFDWMAVDWNRVVEELNHVVLNLKKDDTVTRFVTDRVPSIGALLAGTFIGFRRG